MTVVLRSGEKQEGVEDSPGQLLRVIGHTLQPEKSRMMATFMANVLGVGPVPQSGSPEYVTHENRILGSASPPSAKAGTSLPKPG